MCRLERLGGALVPVVGRTSVGVVHADAADEGALAEGEGEGGEEVGGGYVDCGVVGGSGSATGERAGDDACVDCSGAGKRVGRGSVGSGGFGLVVHWRVCVTKGGFKRERVGGKPVEEGAFAEDANIRVLRCVDVCVCAGISFTRRTSLASHWADTTL